MTVALFEDFIEREDMLTSNESGDGAHARIHGAGGLVEITTGTTSGNWYQLRTTTRMFSAKLSPIVTASLYTVHTSNLEVFVGLAETNIDSAQDTMGFYRSDAGSAGNWKTRTKSGGTGTDQDTGVTGDKEFVNFSIAASPLEVVYALDGRIMRVEKNNIPSADLWLIVWLKTTTAAARKVVVDFIGAASGR